jgi:carbon storage regulator
MLILARKMSESIYIGDDVRITVVQIRPGRVRLGIEAPDNVRVRRNEFASREPDGEKEEPVAGAAW